MTSTTGKRNTARTGGPSLRKHEVQIERVYDKPFSSHGTRFLVDRVWPRGVRKSALSGVTWLKDVAPTTPLRKWFGHDPTKWTKFRKRYSQELKKHPDAWEPLSEALQKNDIVLLFGARDKERNQAVVLKEFLERRD